MINSVLLAVTHKLSVEWSPNVAVVMIICNLVALYLGYFGIKKENRGKGPALPLSLPALFTGFGATELLAIGSFGHLLGVGMILGMSNSGLL